MISKQDAFDNAGTALLRKGRAYYATPCLAYDPMTFQPAPPRVVATCEDGKQRIFPASMFLSREEIREERLNELGI